jgi:hypothetical protein
MTYVPTGGIVMAKDPSSIHQFRALAAVEQAFADDPGIARAALDRLAEPLDLERPTAVGVEDRTARAGAEDPLAHARAHWLGGVYFPGLDDRVVLEGLRAGFEAAVRDAQAEDKPLIPVWISLGDGDSSFRVDHTVTATAVVLAIMTPKPQ